MNNKYKKQQITLDLLETGDFFIAEFFSLYPTSIGITTGEEVSFLKEISGNSNPDYLGKTIKIKSNKAYLYLSKTDIPNVVKILTEDGIAYFEPQEKNDKYYLIKEYICE